MREDFQAFKPHPEFDDEKERPFVPAELRFVEEMLDEQYARAEKKVNEDIFARNEVPTSIVESNLVLEDTLFQLLEDLKNQKYEKVLKGLRLLEKKHVDVDSEKEQKDVQRAI